MLMDMAMQIIGYLVHAALMQGSMAQHAVELWKLAPHHDLVETVVEVRAFDIIVISKY
jgi:hypothetical protein